MGHLTNTEIIEFVQAYRRLGRGYYSRYAPDGKWSEKSSKIRTKEREDLFAKYGITRNYREYDNWNKGSMLQRVLNKANQLAMKNWKPY